MGMDERKAPGSKKRIPVRYPVIVLLILIIAGVIAGEYIGSRPATLAVSYEEAVTEDARSWLEDYLQLLVHASDVSANERIGSGIREKWESLTVSGEEAPFPEGYRPTGEVHVKQIAYQSERWLLLEYENILASRYWGNPKLADHHLLLLEHSGGLWSSVNDVQDEHLDPAAADEKARVWDLILKDAQPHFSALKEEMIDAAITSCEKQLIPDELPEDTRERVKSGIKVLYSAYEDDRMRKWMYALDDVTVDPGHPPFLLKAVFGSELRDFDNPYRETVPALSPNMTRYYTAVWDETEHCYNVSRSVLPGYSGE